MGRVGHASCACSIPGADAIPSDNSSPGTCFIAFSFRYQCNKQVLCHCAESVLRKSVTRDVPAPIDEARRNCGPVDSAMADCRKASSAASGCAPALEFLARFRAGRIDAEDRAALRHLLLHEILEHRLFASLLSHLFGDVRRGYCNARVLAPPDS